MRRLAKLLSLVVVTALAVITVQTRGVSFSEDPSGLTPHQSVSTVAQGQSVEDRQAEADRLFQQGLQQARIRQQFREAIQSWEQALVIYRELEDRQGQANVLNNLGLAYQSLSDFRQAIAYYEQALPLFEAIGDRQGQAGALNNLGIAYRNLSDYRQAITHYEQALSLFKTIGDRQGQAGALNNLGIAYGSLSDYRQAIAYYEQALPLSEAIGDRQGQANSLNNLGIAYRNLSNFHQAIAYYEQALPLFEAIGDRQGQANSLNNLGNAYRKLSDFRQAISYYEQALPLFEEIEDRQGQANSLNNLGNTYGNLSDFRQAIAYYEQALPVFRQIGDRAAEGTLLSNMGQLFALQEQPELSIVFYKQSVNVRESIRDDLKELPQELQQSFADSVADDYRALANLLLQQNRILEAQRVLDLLKVQELDEYFQDVQRSAQTETGIDFWQVETDLLALYQQVLDQATELAELEAKPPTSRTAAEQQRLAELRAVRDEAEGWFERFLDDPDVIATVDEIRASTQGQNLEPENFEDLPNNLRQLPQKTAALYPLILEDRLELVLIMPDGPPLRYPIAVSSTELKETIVAFGQALNSPVSNIEPLAQQLYTWLIGPMAQQLDQAGIESLIYAPDGVLRYIPLAALHDGEQYLAQRFSISHVTAASLTDLNLKPQETEGRLLAAACAECSFTVTIADQAFPFADLPFTQTEVEILAEQVDEVDVLLNQAFNPAAMADLPSYRIVHLATHAAFVTGAPEESFIVFGSGDIINLRDIRRDWQLDNAELVVLSACETAVGSAELGSGIEILGLGYQIERAGAQATLASLWKVSDGGTQALMNAFYGALQQADMTKTEALRQAQIALITDDFTAVGGERGTIEIISTETGQPLTGNDLSHPYYWAPFILIGNGL